MFVSLLENSLGKEYNSPAWKIKITLPKGKSKNMIPELIQNVQSEHHDHEETPDRPEREIFVIRQRSPRAQHIKCGVYLLLAAVIYAVGFHYFIAPAQFAPGGVGGIIAMVKHLLNVDTSVGQFDFSSVLLLLINVPLALFTMKRLSKEFLVSTLVESALMMIALFLVDNIIDPKYVFTICHASTVPSGDIGTRIVCALFGGVTYGISLSLALGVNSSTGGADIIAAAIQTKNPGKSVPTLIFIVNLVIVGVSVFVYNDNLMPIFLALIYMFVSTHTSDTIMCGAKSAMKFEVVTEYGEEISQEIISELGHTATVLPAEGMFEHKNRCLLVCVIQPRQVVKFKNIISKYPNTFAYIGTVNEIIGKFRR